MPVLHLLVGSNGAGKTTYVNRVLSASGLPFINADNIAAQLWPEAQAEHAYEAARIAESQRRAMMAAGESFISETVCSHQSKVILVSDASALGYLVVLHVIMLPVDVTVQRVAERVIDGGHAVPETKIRERYERLWDLVAQAAKVADEAHFFDNARASRPYRPCATMVHGSLVGQPEWPRWAPQVLTD
ncbi:ATPase [Nocardioides baekrokdamisoli]|uniref:ATPase n=1 Tax=Nocardioides baekrokdamisoli TaxID=1804624 RepID=A0A3G9IFC1_9ACTN|nr:AAA family ATPase [Nocardioides baekrokdamisoli]BBH17106.1 ATPase [Nocardioides baekrokdamisoli]